ncbi:nuclear transport factor 2 family protein [Paraburkholderia sp. BCC1885]|uniref:nuclear transport factor 2 family protein n=1 Tax=Paraburkholderia sp. BCC1885 TaxID=2562669 RepID=UPI00118253CF|nr:nuclear transport factor 2 family protein [Paraburkholderia sp. BCC1885]
MSDANPYFAEIQAVNAEVQAWYNGTAPAGALDHLMAHFAAQFSMILPDGGTLDWPMLREIFSQYGGARPDFKIQITDSTILTQYPGGAVVTYIERQSDGEHNRNVRRSTAVLELDAHGTVRWRHLQETFCSDPK